jgi:hypothetical protein
MLKHLENEYSDDEDSNDDYDDDSSQQYSEDRMTDDNVFAVASNSGAEM